MKYYEQLLKMGCFTWDELCEAAGSYDAAKSVSQSYLEKGYISRVKRGLYVAVNLADNEPAVSPYRIASKLTQSACVSRHSAFAYHGCANQVSNRIEVSSTIPFAPFAYNGTEFVYLSARLERDAVGVVVQPDGVRVTDMERTVLDNIRDFEKIMGLEELLRCLEMVPMLHEDKLLAYLHIFNKQVLYQKTGYLLEQLRSLWGLTDDFFSQCAANIGKSKRYLVESTDLNDMEYNRKWQLIVPKNLSSATAQGVDDAEV